MGPKVGVAVAVGALVAVGVREGVAEAIKAVVGAAVGDERAAEVAAIVAEGSGVGFVGNGAGVWADVGETDGVVSEAREQPPSSNSITQPARSSPAGALTKVLIIGIDSGQQDNLRLLACQYCCDCSQRV